MKKENFIFYLCALPIIFICASCASMTQNPADDPSYYANNYYITNAERVCFLDPGDRYDSSSVVITSIDGIDPGLKKGSRPMVIPAGRNQLLVLWINMERSVGPASVVFDFEEGKYYSIRFNTNDKSFNVTQLTDQKRIEIGQSFMKTHKTLYGKK